MFQINYNLCKEFPALSPFEIEERTFVSIIDLYAEVRGLQIREEKEIKAIESNEEKVIRRPAGDNWF